MDCIVTVETHTPRRRAGTVVSAIRRMAIFVRRWRERQRTANALGGVDDRALRDLGLSRSEISSMAAEWHGAAPATRIRPLRHSPHAVHD